MNTVLLLKKDLEKYSNGEIKTIANYYKINGKNVNDLRWQIAIRHSQKSQFMTGNYQVDREILLNLDDEDLFNICKTNKYTQEICKEDFWEERARVNLDHKGQLPTEFATWKEFYMENYMENNMVDLSVKAMLAAGVCDLDTFKRIHNIIRMPAEIIDIIHQTGCRKIKEWLDANGY